MKFFAVIFLAAIIAYVSAGGITSGRRIYLQSGPGVKLEYNPPATNASASTGGVLKFILEPCAIKLIGDATCFAQCMGLGNPGGKCFDGECLCLVPGTDPLPGLDPYTGE